MCRIVLVAILVCLPTLVKAGDFEKYGHLSMAANDRGTCDGYKEALDYWGKADAANRAHQKSNEAIVSRELRNAANCNNLKCREGKSEMKEGLAKGQESIELWQKYKSEILQAQKEKGCKE